MYLGTTIRELADAYSGERTGGTAQKVFFICGLVVAVAVAVFVTRVAKKALEKHMEKMDRETNAVIYKMDYKEMKKVENPMPNIREAFSYVVDIGLVANSYEKLFMLVVTYGPSSVEILEPEKIVLKVGDAQGILNAISDIIHGFAAKTIGGVHIRQE